MIRPQRPAIGRIVHFVLEEKFINDGECRPAMIVRPWHDDEANLEVNLQVFLDGGNDTEVDGDYIRWAPNVAHDSDAGFGTWHWPHECPFMQHDMALVTLSPAVLPSEEQTR